MALAILAQSTPAEAGIVSRVYHDAGGDHRYSIYVPRGEAPPQGWPVMLYLHGAEGRGSDGQRQLDDGPAPLIAAGMIDWPILVVFPQCEDVDSPIFECWQADSPDAQRALRILADVERDYAVNTQHRLLVGWSMGGYGAWSVGAATPGLWAAVMPIAGGGDPATASRLRDVPVWAVHGQLDQAILPERSREMVNAVRRAGGHATLTILPNVDHSSWEYALVSQAVLDWFLNPQTPPDSDRLKREAATMMRTDAFARLEKPFTPELVIPRAVSIRLGERALDAIAWGIPKRVAPHALSGNLKDFQTSIDAADNRFDVRLEQMKYLARLVRCDIKALDGGRARIRLGIAPLDIEIGKTQITGGSLVVTADDTLIRVGHLRPVWAELVVHPAIEDHHLRLQLEQAKFSIPDDNWYIRAPADINVQGEGLTRDMVRIGIVGGLYQRRKEFEDRIRNTLPGIVTRFESMLSPGDMEQLATAIWPLPVYRPRLRLQLDDLSVDPHGISVMLGLEADPAVGLPAAHGPQVLAPLGPPAGEISKSDWLEFGIAPNILAPLSQMLIEAGAARIDLLDLPHPRLAELGTRERLCEFVPALRHLPDDVSVKAELIMRKPFQLIPEASTSLVSVDQDSPAALAQCEADRFAIHTDFQADGLQVLISTRLPGLESSWRPYAELTLNLEQPMVGSLVRHDNDDRTIDVRWNGLPHLTVDGSYLSGAEPVTTNGSSQDIEGDLAPIDTERFRELFSAGWEAWTASVAKTQIQAPDLEPGEGPLRIECLHEAFRPRTAASTATPPAGEETVWWLATYLSPGTRLVNSGRTTLTYQARGPDSIWGPPQELKPGQQDTYREPYPLDVRVTRPFRSRTMPVEAGKTFDLPAER